MTWDGTTERRSIPRPNFACPYDDCDGLATSVTDSRPRAGSNAIWRRRECGKCHRRFTTMEHIVQTPDLRLPPPVVGPLL